MKKKLSFKRLGFAAYLVILLFLIKCAFLDSPALLLRVMDRFEQPSKPFYVVLERIYKLSAKDDFFTEMKFCLMGQGRDTYHGIYLRYIGVVGQKWASNDIRSAYVKGLKDIDAEGYFMVISSMGLTGNASLTPLLEELLAQSRHDKSLRGSGAAIASSLYLITGKTDYRFTNETGSEQQLALTPELMYTRKVIVESRGRKRTLEEMVVLDKTYRLHE